MADTDRTLPDVIDATVLPADEVERRRRHDELVYGNSYVFTGMRGRFDVGDEHVVVDLCERRNRDGIVIMGRLPDGVTERMRVIVERFGDKPVSVSVSVDKPVDALALKPRTDDLGPPATQCAPIPAKLTPAEARVARKLSGPWHDAQPWKHRKKGVRR